MTVVLSHTSALQYLHLKRSSIVHLSGARRIEAMMKKPPNLDITALRNEIGLTGRIHLLVGSDGNRRTSTKVICHIWSGILPKGSILETSQGFYLCSPELVFLQMAEKMSLVELIRLGYELCGTYETVSGTIASSPPLTTVARLDAFLAKVNRKRGVAKARRALAYIHENSASPMETVVAMLFCLPYKLGGYGFPAPELNYGIDRRTGKRARSRAGSYVCDLYWPDEKAAIEYDSDLFHTGEERLAKASIRRRALAELGITVVTVTNRQVSTISETDGVARLLGQAMGKRLICFHPKHQPARTELRALLLSPGNRAESA